MKENREQRVKEGRGEREKSRTVTPTHPARRAGENVGKREMRQSDEGQHDREGRETKRERAAEKGESGAREK